jgi:tRNA A-37 threonylcarbamoyl transferase component Bud32
MPARHSRRAPRIESFDFAAGRVLASNYRVESKLGSGWEGEVYRVVERRTGVHRAAKLFFPHRNEGDRAVTFYARKLDRLKDCPIVIQYFHSERIRYRRVPITCLVSEYVEGELLTSYVQRQPGKRLHPFEAMHLLYALTRGMEQVHRHREYHGDLHAENVMVRRRGIFFDVKVVDFYHWGAPTTARMREDVFDLIKLFYDAIGGRKHYAKQPPGVKAICRGLRRDLIARSFPTAEHLRHHLETSA